MSIESVRSMIETSKTDATLRQQLQAAEGPEAILTIASEKGYEFTEEELLSVMQEKQLSFGEELSEEQLESVAGGGKGNKTNYGSGSTHYG
jgi:predicted ribosomally synthesized peptide with nif11-like leader